MSANSELRALLDERGVEWGNIRNDGSESDYLTEWQFENNQGKAIAIEWAVGSGLCIEIHRYHLTPEQAVEATLGRDECEWVLEHSGTLYDKWRCSKCGYLYVEPRCDQGITDFEPKFCPECGLAVRR